MFLPDLWLYLMASRRTQVSQSQTANKPENGSSLSGPHLSNEDIIRAIERAQYAGGEATPSTGAETSRFVNPLDVSDAKDSEQYQGCKTVSFANSNWFSNSCWSRIQGKYVPCNDVAAEEKAEAEARLAELPKGLPTDDASRKRLKLWSYMMEYFPDAFLAEVEVAVAGNEQHNPGEPLHWARGKSTDQMNTAWRHQFDYGRGVKKDTDGQWHLAKAIWRLKAQLQLDIEEERRQNADK